MTPAPANGNSTLIRRRSVRAWSVAVSLAIGWHAIFLLWLQGVEVRARTRLPDVPMVQYRPISADGAPAAPGAAAVWSPTLFSLPSIAGFSRAVLTNEIGVRPPLAMPVADFGFLPGSLRAGLETEFYLNAVPRMRESVEEVLNAFPMRVQAEPVFLTPLRTGVVVRMEFAGGLADGQVQDALLPEWQGVLLERSWEAVMFVETDDEGRVRHVFLERRSPSEAFNLELVRMMRTWRVEGVSHPASGRIAIRSFAAIPAAAVQEGRVP